MQLSHRVSVFYFIVSGLLSACNFSESTSSSQSIGATSNIPVGSGNGSTASNSNNNVSGSTVLGSGNTVVASASVADAVAVAVGSAQTISVTFTSSDNQSISGFGLSDTTLPAGWSGPTNFTCAAVTSSNGCVLTLTYAPKLVESSVLALNYIFIDNAKRSRTPGGTLRIPYKATIPNHIVANIAPIGQVTAGIGTGNHPVSISFTTDNGVAATQFSLTTRLGSLPPGWTSNVADTSCAIVSTGNGCQLLLDFAPTNLSIGVLDLHYQYIDDSGASQTGALNIPYSATASGNVIATSSPDGQINSTTQSGIQPVTINFVTDDGTTAAGLQIFSNLMTLPVGWTSALTRFSCSSVNTGNGCQLRLIYAPTTLTSGTVTLNFAYTDSSGAFKTGVVNLPYAATSNDNVTASASPSGQINATVAQGSQSVVLTFVTDDGRPATDLQITTNLNALPIGWSSASPAFSCASLNNSANGCKLSLIYSPTMADTGIFSLGFQYKNNTLETKTGTLAVNYRATTNNNVVGTPSQNPLATLVGNSNNVSITFTTDDGQPANNLSVTSDFSSLPAGWTSPTNSFACLTVSTAIPCVLSLVYMPVAPTSGTVAIEFSYSNNTGNLKAGSATLMYSSMIAP